MKVLASVILTSMALTIVACHSRTTGHAVRTEHERDSLIGHSTLPGARGVQRALQIGDSARVRNRVLDSVSATP